MQRTRGLNDGCEVVWAARSNSMLTAADPTVGACSAGRLHLPSSATAAIVVAQPAARGAVTSACGASDVVEDGGRVRRALLWRGKGP